MRLAICSGVLAVVTVACVNLSSVIHLPDGGTIDIPDASTISDLEFDAVIGDPGPLLDGGTTMFGPLTFTTTFSGKARTLVVSEGSTTLQKLVYLNGDDTDIAGTGDTNLDGTLDWRYSSQLDGGTQTTTTLEDTDFDGVFDTQDVSLVDVSQGRPFQKSETVSTYLDADGGFAAADAGTWVEQWSYSGVGVANQGMNNCDGMVGFPSDTSQTLSIHDTQIQIVNSSNPGGCSSEQATLLSGAFKQALINFAIGIASVNPKAAGAVKAAVQTRSLLVACGNTCAGLDASTDLPDTTWSQQVEGGPARMNLNLITLQTSDGGARTIPQIDEVLIHELLHFAGYDHNPPDQGNPPGHDMVYGCGRYGTQCKSAHLTGGWNGVTVGAAEYSYDCADCADSFRSDACGTYAYISKNCTSAACNAPDEECDPVQAVCCPYTQLSCWTDNAADLGSRKLPIPYPPGAAQLACTTQVTVPGDPNANIDCTTPDVSCTPGQTVDNLYGVRTNCTAFPVGWCTSGSQ